MDELQSAALQLFLKRLMSRSVLTDAEKNAVRGLRGRFVQVKAHTDFVGLGQQMDHACLIVDGLAGRFGQTREGARQITCLYIPGDMADLHSVVTSKAGWALGALTRTTILKVPHSSFRRLATKHPGLAESFWRDCVADGSIFSQWVVNVGRRDAFSRLAHLFCELAIRCEQAGKGDRRAFRLPITQAGLADATGLTSVHVNRTMRQLVSQSIVELQKGIMTIHDWNRLVSIGDFDPAYLLLDGPSPRLTDTV